MEKLSEIAFIQPQAAFTHVFLHRWPYSAQTVPMSPEFFHPLNEVLSLHFLPAVSPLNVNYFHCHGRLGVIIPTAYFFSLTSSHVAAPLVDHPVVSMSINICKISCCNDLSAQADLFSVSTLAMCL